MARVKLSEYRAKSLLIPEGYKGASLHQADLEQDLERLDATTSYIIKVDQGIKKRGKQGLIRLNITKSDAKSAVDELAAKGFQRFIAEPMVTHDDSEEQYVSFERTRDGITIMHSLHGGVHVEEYLDSIESYTPDTVPLPRAFVDHIVRVMNDEQLAFIEINPLLIQGDEIILLDAAVLADSAGQHLVHWSSEDIVEATVQSPSEKTIATIDENSAAAFSFKILNPDGALWLLLSGGGASITIADEASNLGKAHLIGNYGEYSGGPTAEETYLYTKAVLEQALASTAPRKALVIAGGVANFTDVKKTFTGLIQAFEESIDQLRSQGFKVYVRRGGPHESEGLALMKEFLEKNSILGSVHGSGTILTDVIHESLEYIDA